MFSQDVMNMIIVELLQLRIHNIFLSIKKHNAHLNIMLFVRLE